MKRIVLVLMSNLTISSYKKLREKNIFWIARQSPNTKHSGDDAPKRDDGHDGDDDDDDVSSRDRRDSIQPEPLGPVICHDACVQAGGLLTSIR